MMDKGLVPIEEEQEEERMPTCGLCQGSLRKPRVLPCFDMFCTECLERHFEGKVDGTNNTKGKTSDNTTCPTCSEPLTLPVGGVKELRLANHMGFLTGFLSARESKKCQYCEEEKKIAETFCIHCSLSMCATCRKMHSRVRGTHTHNVIVLGGNEVSDVISSISDLLKKRETPCTCHDLHPLRFVCVTCKALACVSCKLESHTDHKIEPLEKMASEVRKSLVELSAYITESQGATRRTLQEGNRYLVKLRDDCSRAEKHIEEEAHRMIAHITAKKDEVLAKLQAKRSTEEDTVTKHLDSLKWTDRKVTNAVLYLKDALLYASDAEIVDVTPFLLTRYREIRKKEDLALAPAKLKVTISKSPSDKPITLADASFGVTLDVACPELQKGLIVKTLTTDGSITGLSTTTDDLIVVTSFLSKKVSIYKKTGPLVCEVKKGLRQPISVAVTPSQHILVTELGTDTSSMGVLAFTNKGEALPDKVVLQDSPWDLTVSQSGELIVCHPERHKVGIYGPDGGLRVSIHSSNGRQIFSNPRCVAVNIDGNIVVSDFAKHSLLIFDPEGNFIRSYGSEGEDHEQLRHPCGVCCDRYGHILIADSNNNRIHVLSAQGEFRGYLLSKAAGLVEPVAVEVDHSGELIIGEWSGRIHVVRYI